MKLFRVQFRIKMMWKAVFIFLLISSLINAFDLNLDHQDDYIDPFDMINYDGSTMKKKEMKPSEETNVIKENTVKDESKQPVPAPAMTASDAPKIVSEKEKVPVAPQGSCKAACKPCEVKECLEHDYMKRYIRILLGNFRADSMDFAVPVSYQMTKTVNNDDIAVLKRYGTSNEGSIQDVSEVLSHMVKHVVTLEQEYHEPFFDLDQFIVNSRQVVLLLQILSVVALVVFIFYLEGHIHLSWKSQTVRLVIICFIISVPWNWLHLYKKAASKKTSEVLKGIPDECRPTDTSWLSSVNSWYRTTFTFMENKCDKYHEALEVDPFWEVSPLQAIAVSLSTFIFEPAGHFGEAISKFFRGLLQHVPIQWAVPLFVVVIVMAVLILFMAFGYRIKIPFIAAIEPAERITTAREHELLKRIHTLEDINCHLHERIPSLLEPRLLQIDSIGVARQISSDLGIERSRSCNSIPLAIDGDRAHVEQTQSTRDSGDTNALRPVTLAHTHSLSRQHGQGDDARVQLNVRKTNDEEGHRKGDKSASKSKPDSGNTAEQPIRKNTLVSTYSQEVSPEDDERDVEFQTRDLETIGRQPVENQECLLSAEPNSVVDEHDNSAEPDKLNSVVEFMSPNNRKPTLLSTHSQEVSEDDDGKSLKL